MSAEHLSAAADVPRVRVAGGRTRFAMIAAAFVIPIVAIVLALTLSGSGSSPPLRVHAQNGSYAATLGTPLSVTAFRIANTSGSTVTITHVRVAKAVTGLSVIGGLAYRGCNTCVTDSAVPPHVTPPTDVRAPPLLAVGSFTLKPGGTLTLLLSVKLTRPGRVQVPPIRIDVTGNGRTRSIVTASGPELCAGKDC